MASTSLSSQQTAHAPYLPPSGYVTNPQTGNIGYSSLPLNGFVPTGTNIGQMNLSNMNVLQNGGNQSTGLVHPPVPNQLSLYPQSSPQQTLGQLASPTSPILYQTSNVTMSPLTSYSNGHVGSTLPGLVEFNGNFAAQQDSNIQYLLEQHQQQMQQYRALQLQQQQLQQQQLLIQEQLSRLPQTPPITPQTIAQGSQGWQFQQHALQSPVMTQNLPSPQQPTTLLLSTADPNALLAGTLSIQHAQMSAHQQCTEQQIPDQISSNILPAPNTDQDVVDAPKIAAAPPHTYIPNPVDPRQNTLPLSLPTSLNPSLKVKPSFGIEAEEASLPPTSLSWEGSKVETYQDDHNTSGIGSSVASSLSPTGSSPTSPNFGRTGEYMMAAYERPPTKDACLRCLQKVYAMEQIGPIKGVLYHKNCFVCAVCGTRLNLKNFQHNPNDMEDLSVYCSSHRPREKAAACDAHAVLIKTALGVPKLDKVNEQIRSDQHSPRLGLDRKPSIVAASLPNQREHYFYGMGLQQQQEYCSQQQQLIEQQQQLLQQQQQETMRLIQQQQQQRPQHTSNDNQDSQAELGRKSSLVSSSSQTGDFIVSSPTKCLDDVFNPPPASPSGQTNRKSGSSPGSPATPMSSASSSLSSATGRSLGRRREADGSASMVDGMANDLTDKLSLSGSTCESTGVAQHQGSQGSSANHSPHIAMRRSDRPSSLEDQSEPSSLSCDRASIGSCTSNTSAGRDSLDGATINGGAPPGQKVSTSSMERTDRPSSRSSTSSASSLQHQRQHQYIRQCSGLSTASMDSTGSSHEPQATTTTPAPAVEAGLERKVSAKVLLKSRSEMDFDLQKKERERNARFLPRNESMRMDRPSQYS
ncbi:kyphoscoliosis peptidase [Plakobranchus ocellatus]|uniref:Kyphoscoliosis peptidase n=1 Tax=Plakobranchus ocellatus TaxID=259542 RepID=A0AAV4DL94_9GAST|nr:kyphoscoliosis peptidase [Plakobranchus ocellatus]